MRSRDCGALSFPAILGRISILINLLMPKGFSSEILEYSYCLWTVLFCVRTAERARGWAVLASRGAIIRTTYLPMAAVEVSFRFLKSIEEKNHPLLFGSA